MSKHLCDAGTFMKIMFYWFNSTKIKKGIKVKYECMMIVMSYYKLGW